jgi:sulfur carrier protein ThiS
MPEILILPENKKIISKEGVSIKYIIRSLGFTDPDEVAIIINDELIELSDEYIIRKHDRIIIIRQGIGG